MLDAVTYMYIIVPTVPLKEFFFKGKTNSMIVENRKLENVFIIICKFLIFFWRLRTIHPGASLYK